MTLLYDGFCSTTIHKTTCPFFTRLCRTYLILNLKKQVYIIRTEKQTSTTPQVYSPFRWTKMDQDDVRASSPDLKTLALHPYPLLSPSSKSAISTLSLDCRVEMVSIKQEEYSPYVTHSLVKVLRYAKTELSEIVYIFKERSFISVSR